MFSTLPPVSMKPPSELLKKYNLPVPRYTSYPTVPYWEARPPSPTAWQQTVATAFAENRDVSIYIHLPFCEQLCTYCGCNKRITRNHAVEEPYLQRVLKEWALYLSLFDTKPVLRELHLGGGTPTFFSPANLRRLLEPILQSVIIPDDHEFSLEVHPNSTTVEHLEVLHDLGFRRVSIGVQDFSPDILGLIHRFQTTEQVNAVTHAARELGYTSVNYDLIFGLPRQNLRHIADNINHIERLRPERIAFYSYAHVPWMQPGQRAYDESDLPTDAEKRALYDLGRTLLEQLGYREVGMDHFALPADRLYQALQTKTLHRNFMGYTPLHTELLVGLGVSAISDAWYGFAQNEKKLEDYYARVDAGGFAFFKGHLLTEEDLLLRRHILNLMCHFHTAWDNANADQTAILQQAVSRLQPLVADGLVETTPTSVSVTPLGVAFVRNVCMAFDARLWRNLPTSRLFSSAV